MKTQIIPTEKEVKEIDWSKPQLVKSIHDSELILLTSGYHDDNLFNGTILIETKSGYHQGWHQTDWYKTSFTPHNRTNNN